MVRDFLENSFLAYLITGDYILDVETVIFTGFFQLGYFRFPRTSTVNLWRMFRSFFADLWSSWNERVCFSRFFGEG